MAEKLEDAIARNILRLRNAKGWTQSDLAAHMRHIGFGTWQQNRVTQIETFRRPVTMLETISLAWVFGVRLADLFQGEGSIEIPTGTTTEVASVNLDHLHKIVAGDPRLLRWAPRRSGLDVGSDEIRKIAKQLALPVPVFTWLVQRVYGRSLMEERDKRAGDATGLPKRSVQAKRGNVTRTLIAELTGVIRAEGGVPRICDAFQADTGIPWRTLLNPGERDTQPAKMAADEAEDSAPAANAGQP